MRQTHQSANDLMNNIELDAVWIDGRCSHPRPVLHLYGIFAQLECDICKQKMLFRLKFGYSKTFEVAINDRPVGHTSILDTQQFINSHSTGIVMPDEHTLAGLKNPLRDSKMLEILIDTLFPIDLKRLQQCPIDDYEKALRDIPCTHKSIRCQIYGDTIGMTCKECTVVLLFRLVADDVFNTRITYGSPTPVEYGIHYIREIIDTIRSLLGTLGIPNMMADKMSDDPERDACNISKIIQLFVKHGLLEHSKYGETLSAMACSREEFETRMVDNVERQAMEESHLSWPCIFIGRGIDVTHYDITGSAQYCIRCSFSTLDGKGGNWKSGCPHCGYVGYLLDLGDEFMPAPAV